MSTSARGTIGLVVTVLVGLVVAGPVDTHFGWLPGLVVLLAIAAVGGLAIRFDRRRELDKYIREHGITDDDSEPPKA